MLSHHGICGIISFNEIYSNPDDAGGMEVAGNDTFNAVSFSGFGGSGGGRVVGIATGGSATFKDTVSFSNISDGNFGIFIDIGKATFKDVSFGGSIGGSIGGAGIAIYGSGTFNDTVSFSDISNNGIGIGFDPSGTGIFQDVSFKQPVSGQGIDASSNNISYYSICGDPSSNVWPTAGATDNYTKRCFSRTSI